MSRQCVYGVDTRLRDTRENKNKEMERENELRSEYPSLCKPNGTAKGNMLHLHSMDRGGVAGEHAEQPSGLELLGLGPSCGQCNISTWCAYGLPGGQTHNYAQQTLTELSREKKRVDYEF